MPKITIYTQAYNAEKYMEQCILSVLNQTLTDFEYILVDNGSTDRTRDIIYEYAEKDIRIKALRFEENKRGFWIDLLLESSQGEYFTMLDSDDFLENNYLEELYNFAKDEDLDIAMCGTCFHIMETNKKRYRKISKDIIFTKEDLPKTFSLIYQFIRPFWGKISKMSVIKNTDFQSYYKLVKIGYGGDTAFSISTLDVSKNIGITEKVLHNYRVHNKSSSYIYNTNRFYSDSFLFYEAEQFLKKFGKISSDNYEFLYLVYLNAIRDTINVILNSNLSLINKLKEIQNILKDKLTQQMFNGLSYNSNLKKFKQDIFNLLIKIAKQNYENIEILDNVYECTCMLDENFKQFVLREKISMLLEDSEFIYKVFNLDEDSKFTNNILLKQIKNKKFIFQYPEVIRGVYENKYYDSIDKIISILSLEEEAPLEDELLILLSNIAAIVKNGEIFILSKKLQVELLIQHNNKVQALAILKELNEMCPDDEDVINLNKLLAVKNE